MAKPRRWRWTLAIERQAVVARSEAPTIRARSLAEASGEEDLDEARDRLVVRLNTIINPLAGREDLLLSCVWNPKPVPGQPNAPAWFSPGTAHVTVNAKIALGDAHPADVNPLTPPGRRAHPVLAGLCCHEASHAHSTQWPERFGRDVPPAVVKAAVLLEEPRIELRQLQRRPQDRPYLRAQSVLLDLKQFAQADQDPVLDRWRAANAAVLVLARVDAEVLEPEDAEHLEPVLRGVLGDDLDALRDVWQQALDLSDGDVSGMLDVAEQWVNLLGEPPAEQTPTLGCSMEIAAAEAGQEGATVGDSDGTGSPDPLSPPTEDEWETDGEADDSAGDAAGGGDDPLTQALAATIEAARDEAQNEIDAASDDSASAAATEAQEQAAQKSEDIKDQDKATKRAEKVFHGHSNTGNASPLGVPRPPTLDERRLARQIGSALRRAQFRERTSATRRSELPPGRLNGRDAMLADAQRSMGAPVTAKPFKTTVRRHVPEPPLTLGIMVDVSGSMGWATDIMATTAWAFSQAITQVHGSSATVAFGWKVTPVVHPGRPPAKVMPFEADDGTERFKDGFAALDGAINLTMGKGARLLIVVSDGHFVGAGEPDAAREAVTRLRRNGGHTLWVSLDDKATVPDGAIPVEVDPRNADDIPATLTKALTTALVGA